MDLFGKMSIRFLANMVNPESVDLAMRMLSREISHGIKAFVSSHLDFVAASAILMPGRRVKVPGRFMNGLLKAGFLLVAWTDSYLILLVGHLAVRARGSRREVKARSGGSIPH